MNLGEIFYTFDQCALQVRKDLLLPELEIVAFTMSDIAKIESREPRRCGAPRQQPVHLAPVGPPLLPAALLPAVFEAGQPDTDSRSPIR
ncbi:MAG: hypothetical protein VCE43_05325 [Myxococcota bacterium]